MSILMKNEHADFNYLKEKTEATSGNLSVQITKLEEAGYLRVEKSFKDKKPHTTCHLTNDGLFAFEKYVTALKNYLNT